MKDLTIHNFRCYDTKSIEFRPGINLFVGDNASGKTSLIRACNFVANAFFCGYSDENTIWKSVDEIDFKQNIGEDNTILPEKPVVIDFHLANWDFPSIEYQDGNTKRCTLQSIQVVPTDDCDTCEPDESMCGSYEYNK